MKSTPITIPIICAAAFYAVALASPSAQANSIPISGSIGFGASGVSINSPNLMTATSFAVSNPFVTSMNGSYSGVPLFDSAITFNGFVFTPAIGSISPLWAFNIGSTVYSFDATSDSSFWNASLQSWEIGGNGIAMISGFTPTAGTWNVNLSQSGDSFVFDSSAASVPGTSVPDGGSTVALLGCAFLGVSAFRRKCSC